MHVYVCLCVHVDMYVCVYLYMHVCMCMRVCVGVYMHLCLWMWFVYVCLCLCVHVYVCMHVCVCVCTCLCMCLHVCLYMYVCVHVCVHMWCGGGSGKRQLWGVSSLLSSFPSFQVMRLHHESIYQLTPLTQATRHLYPPCLPLENCALSLGRLPLLALADVWTFPLSYSTDIDSLRILGKLCHWAKPGAVGSRIIDFSSFSHTLRFPNILHWEGLKGLGSELPTPGLQVCLF